MYINIFTLFIRSMHVVIDEEKHKWAEAFITIDKIKKVAMRKQIKCCIIQV